MAISMSSATIDSSEREDLKSSEVDKSITGGDIYSGENLAGITPDFAANVVRAIEQYTSEVQSKLDQLQAVESNSAFKGQAIDAALSNFVDSIREVGTSYLKKLEAAEQQIINSVDKAYSTQIQDLAKNLRDDSSSLMDQKVS